MFQDANFLILCYYNILLFFVLAILFYSNRTFCAYKPLLSNGLWSILLLLFVFVVITFRPTDSLFADTVVYAKVFENNKMYSSYELGNDFLFSIFTYYCAKYFSLVSYWGIICFIYIMVPSYVFKYRFPNHYYWLILSFITSLSFWGYGVNGLRNGMATSLILAAFLLPGMNIVRLLFFILAVLFHKSVCLPLAVFFIVLTYQKTKVYILLWISAILFSYLFGDFFTSVFSNINLFEGDSRFSDYLLTNDYGDMFSSTSFRWDFILYSSLPIILAYWCIYGLNFKDKLYQRLLHTYIVTNIFWILIITASFSNRFAYLSWFMIPVISLYPFLKVRLLKKQTRVICIIILFYYSFTYYMAMK